MKAELKDKIQASIRNDEISKFTPSLPDTIDVEESPYKKIVIHEVRKMPFNVFKKRIDTFNQISWCGGYLMTWNEYHSDAMFNEIILNNTIHIQYLLYCKHDYMPKDSLVDEFSEPVNIINPEYHPLVSSFIKYINSKENEV